MDPDRFSAIAHLDHVFCSPLSLPKVDQLIDVMDPAPGARVLDVGCGKAGFLVRLVVRAGIEGVGVDRSPYMIQEARARAELSVPDGRLQLRHADITTVAFEPNSFDVALCIGSSQAYGGYRETLRALRTVVRPGGRVLVGEGYWKREPAEDYLQGLGASRDAYGDHAGNVRIGVEEGLIPLYSCASSEDEWDHYEGLYLRGIENYVERHADDVDAAPMLDRIRAWRDVYLRWGRSTLGFGLYVFRVEE